MNVMPSAMRAYSTPIMTPAISVWTKSSVEYMGDCPHPYPPPTSRGREPRDGASCPLLQRQLGEGWGGGTGQERALRRAAHVFQHHVGLAPILVGLGVVQDQDRRRPVVEVDAVGARELDV